MGPADPLWDVGNVGLPHVAKGRATLTAIFDIDPSETLSAETHGLADRGTEEKAVLCFTGLFGKRPYRNNSLTDAFPAKKHAVVSRMKLDNVCEMGETYFRL